MRKSLHKWSWLYTDTIKVGISNNSRYHPNGISGNHVGGRIGPFFNQQRVRRATLGFEPSVKEAHRTGETDVERG